MPILIPGNVGKKKSAPLKLELFQIIIIYPLKTKTINTCCCEIEKLIVI